jgi:NAD(P)-dependent dehydrogenase (short-subunit alcohol dehydrogenase family)
MGIRVNAIAPGPIDTGMTKMRPDQRKRYLERLPIGRFGAAGDIAAIAVFLATEDASFMTGSIVNADGGFDAAGLIFDYDELVNVKSDGRDPDFKP